MNEKDKLVIIPLSKEEQKKLQADLDIGKARFESSGAKFKLLYEQDAEGKPVRKWIPMEE